MHRKKHHLQKNHSNYSWTCQNLNLLNSLAFFLCDLASEFITLTTTTSSPSSSLVPSCWRSHQGHSWASTSAVARRHSWASSYPRCLSVLLWVCVCVCVGGYFDWLVTDSCCVCVCLLLGGPWLGCTQGRSSGRWSSSLCEWCWFPRHRALQSEFLDFFAQHNVYAACSFCGVFF